jgi:hypothetical protein
VSVGVGVGVAVWVGLGVGVGVCVGVLVGVLVGVCVGRVGRCVGVVVGVVIGSGSVGSPIGVDGRVVGAGVAVVGVVLSGMSGTARGSTLRSALPVDFGTDRLPLAFGIRTAFLL